MMREERQILRSEELKSSCRTILQIIRLYDWLLNSFVLDFYVDHHWNKLPKSWRTCFSQLDPKDFGDLITNNDQKVVAPLSFLTLLSIVKNYSIERNPKTNVVKEDCGKLKNIFLKHVKLKKRHEIELMALTIANEARICNCNCVVDFGSGLGHLVRTLAYKYGLDAIGIEQDETLIEDARKLDKEFEYTAIKLLTKPETANLKTPSHVNTRITNTNSINSSFNSNDHGLIGLHPCGDLGPNLLKTFVKNKRTKFICLVGCCFMKLSCGQDSNCGYPMSSYVKNLEGNELSYESREIACHAIENYCERLCSGTYQDLQVHSYRAMLELLLVRKDIKMKHIGIRSIKHSNTLTFQRYCELATERLNIKLNLNDINSKECIDLLSQWRNVVIFYTCRLMLAPLVETLVLYDRLLFLKENDIDCELKPVFNPKLSPRNHILIGRKKS